MKVLTSDNRPLLDAMLQRCLTDGNYRLRLLNDPRGVLAEEGIHVPAGTVVTTIELPANTMPLILPPMLTEAVGTLEEEEFQRYIATLESEDEKVRTVVVKLCCMDKDLRNRFLKDPRAVFQEFGCDPAPNMDFMPIDSPEDTFILPVPVLFNPSST
jgi:hypothetical protein